RSSRSAGRCSAKMASCTSSPRASVCPSSGARSPSPSRAIFTDASALDALAAATAELHLGDLDAGDLAAAELHRPLGEAGDVAAVGADEVRMGPVAGRGRAGHLEPPHVVAELGADEDPGV